MENLTETYIKVRFAECDYYQHVNNAMYMTYLDVSLADFLREIWPDLHSADFALHNVHTTMDLFDSATFEDELIIRSKIKEIGTSSIRFEYEIIKKTENKKILQAEKVFVTLDLKGNKIPIPNELKQIYLK